MVELKPCPFCGNANARTHYEDICSLPHKWTIKCGDDDCPIEFGWHESEADAAKWWNARPDSLALTAAVQGEREACARILDEESFQEPSEQETLIYAKRGFVGGEIVAFSHADRLAKLIRARDGKGEIA